MFTDCCRGVGRHQANGTQGRLVSWTPERPDKDKKALLASHPDLSARFVKEASVSKPILVADEDFIDVSVRQENLMSVPGAPVMVQMPLQPCYGLTTCVCTRKHTQPYMFFVGPALAMLLYRLRSTQDPQDASSLEG